MSILGPIPPSIAITSPTPPRTTSASTSATTAPTPPSVSKSPSSYRLLYRGALSLPDSHLLLDGLTFSACLDHNTSTFPHESPTVKFKLNASNLLLQSPLALALESMRGRPSLCFVGIVKMREVWVDECGSVEMEIHPNATLTRIYFENMFCLNAFPAASTSASPVKDSRSASPVQRSDVGIKVALGDSDGPETTQIIISAICTNNGNMIQLTVGRLTSAPLGPLSVRLPRPDDPIPRKPPPSFLLKDNDKETLKRVASGSLSGARKRARLSGSVAGDLGSGVRLGGGGEEVFKIPEVPRWNGKGKEKSEKDVFGEVVVTGGKGKQQRKADHGDGREANGGVGEVEQRNKIAIKKAAVEYLARTKDPSGRTIDKTHPEFKEVWGYVYRGVMFAVRGRIKSRGVDSGVVERLIGMHVGMYVDGVGVGG